MLLNRRFGRDDCRGSMVRGVLTILPDAAAIARIANPEDGNGSPKIKVTVAVS